jgi:hypothetical protein
MGLVKLFIDSYRHPEAFCPSAVPGITQWEELYTGWLDALRPGQHLTGDDVLELLEFVTEKGWV